MGWSQAKINTPMNVTKSAFVFPYINVSDDNNDNGTK
jgi:hypothetical protein